MLLLLTAGGASLYVTWTGSPMPSEVWRQYDHPIIYYNISTSVKIILRKSMRQPSPNTAHARQYSRLSYHSQSRHPSRSSR